MGKEFAEGVRDFLLVELQRMGKAGYNPDLAGVDIAIIGAAAQLALEEGRGAFWGVPSETSGTPEPATIS